MFRYCHVQLSECLLPALVTFPACPGRIAILPTIITTTTTHPSDCSPAGANTGVIGDDEPLPMAIFELLEYLVNEVTGSVRPSAVVVAVAVVVVVVDLPQTPGDDFRSARAVRGRRTS